MGRYISALLTPAGRLPVMEYWIFILPITLATIVGRGYVRRLEDDPPTWIVAAVLILIWMAFCVTSRRLQDMNYPGFLCFPLFAASAVVFLADVDLSIVGDDEGTLELVEQMRRWSGVAMALVIGCGGIMGESHAGPNIYGPHIDAPPGKGKKKSAADGDLEQSARLDRIKRTPSRSASGYAGEGAGVVRPRAAADTPGGRPRGFGRR